MDTDLACVYAICGFASTQGSGGSGRSVRRRCGVPEGIRRSASQGCMRLGGQFSRMPGPAVPSGTFHRMRRSSGSRASGAGGGVGRGVGDGAVGGGWWGGGGGGGCMLEIRGGGGGGGKGQGERPATDLRSGVPSSEYRDGVCSGAELPHPYHVVWLSA